MLRSPLARPFRRLAPLVALLAVVTAACSSVTERGAATVNGTDISVESLQEELKTIRSDDCYQRALEQQYGEQLGGAGKGTFRSAFTAQLLSLRIYYELFEQRLAEDDALPSASEVNATRDQLRDGLKQACPKLTFTNAYYRQLARQDALVAKLQEEVIAGAIGEAYVEEHPEEFAQACASHILVSTETRSETEALRKAEQLKSELDAGADFASVARDNTEDPGSKDSGGDLGCALTAGYVEEFKNALASQPIGTVGSPVKTEFGYHLIIVKSRGVGTLAEADQQLQQQVFSSFLLELTCGSKTKVSVNPQYGRWDRGPCKDETGLPRVLAPTPPTTEKK